MSRYGSKLAAPDAELLAENGHEVYGWRIVDRQPVLVVVGLGFTVVARPHETFEAFRARMLELGAHLALLHYPVTHLTFHRREAQRRQPWAEFECATPEASLPEVGDGGQRARGGRP